MRVRTHNIDKDLYVLEVIESDVTRLIVTDKNYGLSYELLSMFNDKVKNFDVKSYVKTLKYETLLSYLEEVNDNEDDCLYHERLIDDFLVKDDE